MLTRDMTTDICQPIIFLSHGAGPSFYIDAKDAPYFKGMDKDSWAAAVLRSFVKDHNIKTPRALVVLSAHWEESTCSVTSSEHPSLYYDYGGFPSETYQLQWSVPGSPDVAKRVKELLEAQGIPCKEDSRRGLDHGVFVPLKLVFPKADIPVIQVSLLKSSDMSEHLRIGEVLADLRQENVLVIGSGFATHSGFSKAGLPWAGPFKVWLHDLVSNLHYSPAERKARFLAYSKEWTFSHAHPSMEHFLPIAMCCAAGGYRPGLILHTEFAIGSLLNDHYKFPAN